MQRITIEFDPTDCIGGLVSEIKETIKNSNFRPENIKIVTEDNLEGV